MDIQEISIQRLEEIYEQADPECTLGYGDFSIHGFHKDNGKYYFSHNAYENASNPCEFDSTKECYMTMLAMYQFKGVENAEDKLLEDLLAYSVA